MLLGGLWHGAAWTFVIWGGVHGTALVLERIAKERLGWHLPAVVRWFIVFNVVVFAWVLFRSQDLSLALTFLGRIGSGGSLTLLSLPVALALFAAVGLQLLPPRPLEALRLRLEQWPAVALGVGLALVVVFVGATVPSAGVPPFIYFRF
jgi:hypothetical protein